MTASFLEDRSTVAAGDWTGTAGEVAVPFFLVPNRTWCSLHRIGFSRRLPNSTRTRTSPR
jgi:hypothetical protein